MEELDDIEQPFQLTIRKIENAYVLLNSQGLEFAYEESDNPIYQDNNKDHVIKLLYKILEEFDEQGSKHDGLRIKIGYTANSTEEVNKLRKQVSFSILKEI